MGTAVVSLCRIAALRWRRMDNGIAAAVPSLSLSSQTNPFNTGSIMADAEQEWTAEDYRDEAEGWHRIALGKQGEERGWDAACRLLRERAGGLFAKGDDREAESIRDVAEWLEGHPLRAEIRKETAAAFDRFEEDNAKAEILASDAPPA